MLNGIQYFYLTNPSGDVVGITDAEGNLIAEYSYDEWGKLLSITTAEENNAEQLKIAQVNPLRYRGYYYDNETGMYYLQSRYYDPELCRFISADNFGFITNNKPQYVNAYCYCINNPILFEDYEGTYIKSGDVPPSSSGYIPPKGGPRKVPVPGMKDGTKGWVDKNGDIWYPDKLHNGSDSEHWDVVDKNGKNHRNVYPPQSNDGENASISVDMFLFTPSENIIVVIFEILIISVVAFVFITFLPLFIPVLSLA